MTPVQALRELEVAVELIPHGPQNGSNVVEAIRGLRRQVERWRLLYLWGYLQFDAKAGPNRLIGANQNASAALRGIAHDLKMELLSPVELAALVTSRALQARDADDGRS